MATFETRIALMLLLLLLLLCKDELPPNTTPEATIPITKNANNVIVVVPVGPLPPIPIGTKQPQPPDDFPTIPTKSVYIEPTPFPDQPSYTKPNDDGGDPLPTPAIPPVSYDKPHVTKTPVYVPPYLPDTIHGDPNLPQEFTPPSTISAPDMATATNPRAPVNYMYVEVTSSTVPSPSTRPPSNLVTRMVDTIKHWYGSVIGWFRHL